MQLVNLRAIIKLRGSKRDLKLNNRCASR